MSTILHRRDGYRRAFAGFDPSAVAAFGDDDVRRLMADPGVVRNRRKIVAAVDNARATLALGGEAALAELLWGFVVGAPSDRRPASLAEIPAQTEESQAMSRELVRRGFRFVGPTICYALMQAGGMVNDHVTGCTAGDGIRAAIG